MLRGNIVNETIHRGVSDSRCISEITDECSEKKTGITDRGYTIHTCRGCTAALDEYGHLSTDAINSTYINSRVDRVRIYNYRTAARWFEAENDVSGSIVDRKK